MLPFSVFPDPVVEIASTPAVVDSSFADLLLSCALGAAQILLQFSAEDLRGKLIRELERYINYVSTVRHEAHPSSELIAALKNSVDHLNGALISEKFGKKAQADLADALLQATEAIKGR